VVYVWVLRYVGVLVICLSKHITNIKHSIYCVLCCFAYAYLFFVCLFNFVNYVFLLYLCILIVMYVLFYIFCFHRANWHSSASLTEVFRDFPQL